MTIFKIDYDYAEFELFTFKFILFCVHIDTHTNTTYKSLSFVETDKVVPTPDESNFIIVINKFSS